MLLENPDAVAYVFEPTYKMVRRILIPTLESKYLLDRPIDANPIVQAYNRSDNCITLVDGQELWFGGLEEPEYAEGTNVDVVLMDEAQYVRKFDESQDVVLRRLRGSGKTAKDITSSIVTTTPPPLLPNCRLYDFYENPATRNPETKIYRWSLLDNPHLSLKYRAEIVATHHGNLAKRFIEGKFATASSGSFDFDSTVNEFKTFDKTMFKQIVFGVDFGWTNQSAIIAVGFDSDDRAYVLEEFYQNRVQTETLIEEAKGMVERLGEGSFYCDRSEPQTIDMFAKAGLDARADTSKREDGIREVGGRFKVQGDGKPRLFISCECVNLISELMTYDVNVKENDHATDGLRYAVMNAKRSPVGDIQVSFAKRT